MNLIIVCGNTGTGKSNFVNKNLLLNTIKKINGRDNYFISPRSKRQYIFDINNEYSFPTDNNILPQMRNVNLDIRKFISLAANLAKTNIIFEDATGFLRGRQSPEIMQQIVKRRHTGNNFIILFHAIANVPPEIMRMKNFLIIFKTDDDLHSINYKFHNAKLNHAFIKVRSSSKYSYQII